jgi:hypothetical protein
MERLPTESRLRGRPKVHPVEVATDRPSWLRQPHESLAAYEAFTTFRDLGPERSLARVAQLMGRPLSTVAKWSSRYGFPARVQDWNRSIAPEHRDKMVERQRQLLDEHHAGWGDIGRAAREQVARNLPTMSDQHLVALALGGAKHELMVVGISEKSASAGPAVTVNVDASNHVSLAQLDDWADRVMSAVVAAYGPGARAVIAAAIAGDGPVIPGELA